MSCFVHPLIRCQLLLDLRAVYTSTREHRESFEQCCGVSRRLLMSWRCMDKAQASKEAEDRAHSSWSADVSLCLVLVTRPFRLLNQPRFAPNWPCLLRVCIITACSTWWWAIGWYHGRKTGKREMVWGDTWKEWLRKQGAERGNQCRVRSIMLDTRLSSL
jgi:hypothetical protein